MVKQVEKRDGRIVKFNRAKIISAIQSAMVDSGDEVCQDIAEDISNKIAETETELLNVDSIHKQVEKGLSTAGLKKALKMYKSYRTKRDIARKAPSRKAFKDIIEAKSSDVTRENANMNADTPAGMMMKFASENTKPYVMDVLLSEKVKEGIENNLIHIHDLDYFPSRSLTCLQHPLDRLFEGFNAGHGSCRSPKRIETAAIQSCISMETIQNEMHGGQAIPAFDFYLAPYVRKTFIEELNKLQDITKHSLSHLYDVEIDDYLKKDTSMLEGDELYKQYAINNTVERVHQSMEAFVHNAEMIHSRGGNQVVFSSINYGTDTSAEGRCIIREILNTTYDGVGVNGQTAIFPIQVWKKKRGVSYLPTDKNYDLYELACKVSAKRFFPNFVNLDATFNQHELWREDNPKRYEHEIATMGKLLLLI